MRPHGAWWAGGIALAAGVGVPGPARADPPHERIERLAAQVRRDPTDRALRLQLAQNLLWVHRVAEAVPHVRQLLADPDASDPLLLEVATWVLAEARETTEARRAAERWIAAAADPTRARWARADLSHWSADWRAARPQYEALLARPREAARARERLELLRYDHPDEVRAEGTFWSDNVGVRFASGALGASVQLPARIVLFPRGEVGHWSQRVNPGAGSLAMANVQLRVRVELWDAVWPELALGAEGDGAGNLAPMGSVGARLSVRGWLFGRIWWQHDRHRVSYQAALRDVRTTGPAVLLYAEPLRWLFASTESMVQWISDDNVRVRSVLVLGVHNPGALQLEARIFAQWDGYRDARADALPYFTPPDPLAYGADVTVRYALGWRFRAEGSAGVVVQDGIVAFRPAATLRGELGGHFRAGLTAGYVGTPLYNQTRLDGYLAWLF